MKNWKRNAALFMIGQGISMFGSMMVHYAVLWHLTLETKSGLMMTFITLVGTLPMFFISPFCGVWADKFNKKLLINLSDAVIACVTLAMAVVFQMGLEFAPLLLICLLVRSFGQGVQSPAVSALIPEIVPEDKLMKVNGINGSIMSLVMFASPMAGAAIFGFVPIQSLLFIDVFTAIIGIGILLLFVKTPNTHKENTQKVHYFSDIKEGLKYIKGHEFIKKILILGAVYNILIAPAAVMSPLQVARDFGEDIWKIWGGLLFSPKHRLASIEVAFSVGMMLGGIIIGIWGGFKNKSHSMAFSVSTLGIGTIGLGIFTNFWVYLACMLGIGLFVAFSQAPLMTMIQANVEPDYMGRVFSVMTMISCLAMPIGMVVWGPLGDKIPIDWIFVGTGICLFLLGFVCIMDKTLLKAGSTGEGD